MFMKDSDGKRSFTVTISVITFAVVMIKVLIGGSAFSFGAISMSFGPIGSDEIAVLLTPVLGTYSFRKYTDRKYGAPPSIFEEAQAEEMSKSQSGPE
jgi:hypothetical protein